jgi:acylphosphatase
VCRQFIVSGRVQGVFFRASTRDVADRVGISGHAINLNDGTVEVIACGDPIVVDNLQAWLHQGPPQAEVADVVEHSVECRSPDGFRTG